MHVEHSLYTNPLINDSLLSDDRNTDIMIDNLSSKSRVKEKVEPAKLEEMLAEQNSENSELSLRQLGGNHGSDFMEPHQKIEISGNQKTHKEVTFFGSSFCLLCCFGNELYDPLGLS